MRPNILILHADQMRFDALGCNGNRHARTPNLDALAAEGTVFTRHFAANPVCTPSRATLFSGLYVPGHGIWRNGIPLPRRDDYGPAALRNWPMPGHMELTKTPVLMPDLFAAAGYDTLSLGKLHFTPFRAPREYGFGECTRLMYDGALSDWHGPYYGFRHVEMTCGHGEEPCRGGHYADWLRANHPDVYARANSTKPPEAYPLPGRKNIWASPVPADLHNSIWLADRFADYLTKRKAEAPPFFAFVGFPDPHHAFAPSFDLVEQFANAEVPEPADPEGEAWPEPEERQRLASHCLRSLTPEQRRVYIRYTYAMVHNIDRAVGRIVAALKASNCWDNTIIVFTSDHGDFLCDHALLLKAQFGSRSLLHVPFVLRAPGAGLPARTATPMSNCDVLPTLAALAGLHAPGDIHGCDIVPIVRDRRDHVALAHCYTGEAARNNCTIHDARYRLTCYPATGRIELYDQQQDPGEVCNLAGTRAVADVQEHLRRLLVERTFSLSNPTLGRLAQW